MTLAAGTRLGPYVIESPLGAGGMGEVYRAKDSRLDRTVAIKVLPAHVASNPDLRERFEREAKTLAALSHPHICPVFDVGTATPSRRLPPSRDASAEAGRPPSPPRGGGEGQGAGAIDDLVMEYLEGQTLAYRAWAGTGANIAVYVGSLDSEERKQLFTLTEHSKLVYADPGFVFFKREGTLFAQPFDEDELELTGDPIRIADEVAYSPTGNAPFDVSQNGVLIYRTGGAALASQLVWFDRTGKRLESVGEPGMYTSLDLSPDGKQVAVSRTNPPTPGSDIWLIERERPVFTRLTFDERAGTGGDLAWSPDGLRVAFPSSRKGNPDVFVKNANGTGGETPLLESSGSEYPEDWSRDGRYLAYSFLPASASVFSTYVLPLFGDRKPFPVVQSNAGEPHFSFDAKWLAYDSDESGTWQTYVTSFPVADQKRQISTSGGNQPRWRQDGKELYYLDPDGKLMAVDITAGAKIDSGIPRELFDTELNVSRTIDQYDVTADGQRFLVLKPVSETTPTPITVVVNWTAGLKK